MNREATTNDFKASEASGFGRNQTTASGVNMTHAFRDTIQLRSTRASSSSSSSSSSTNGVDETGGKSDSDTTTLAAPTAPKPKPPKLSKEDLVELSDYHRGTREVVGNMAWLLDANATATPTISTYPYTPRVSKAKPQVMQSVSTPLVRAHLILALSIAPFLCLSLISSLVIVWLVGWVCVLFTY
jgi:hypothetical protein